MKRTLNIALVNMPFGLLMAPSIALAQLRAEAKRRLGDLVNVRECHVTFDAVEFMGGPQAYMLAHSPQGFLAHFGEWFFSKAAFSEGPGNTEDYLARYYFEDSHECRMAADLARRTRPQVPAFLDSVIERHGLLDADVVGFTLLFFQTTASLALARRIKERKEGVVVIIVGPGCEGSAGQELLKRAPWLDFVFSGPALVSFPMFLERLLEAGAVGCGAVAGVFSKTNQSLWPKNGASGKGCIGMYGAQADINDWLPLDYEPFLEQWRRMSGWASSQKPILLFETSRGCWWAERARRPCVFCGLNNTECGWQAMQPERALEYLRSLARYADRTSCFVAVDTIMPRDYPEKVFSKLGSGGGARFKYEVRPDLSGRDLDWLVSGGVVAVQPGIEALSTRTLRLMGKGLDVFDNLKFLRECTKRPLTVEWNLLLFTPGENAATYERYTDLIPRLFHLPPPLAAYPVMLVRNSRYVLNPAKYRLQLRPQEFYKFIYPFDREGIEKVAFYHVDEHFDQETADTWLERINRLIAHWHERWLGKDGKAPARLCFFDRSGTLVHDSRSGYEVVHRLDPIAAEVLRILNEPASQNAVAAGLGVRTGRDVAELMSRLVSLGLVFEEEGRFLSLVGW